MALSEAPSLDVEAVLLIGDERIADGSGGTYDHVNPATGKAQRTVPLAGPGEVDAAVRTARAALPAWRALPPDQRRDLLLSVAGLLEKNADRLVPLVSLENGTPAMLAPMVAHQLPAEWFRYFAGWCEKLEGEVIPVYQATGLDYTLLEPFGVVGVIIPWNGPLVSIGQKLAAALAAGNCIVLKPPELAPFSAVRFGELCLEAGFPPGVVNVIPGGPEAGDALARHPGIDKLSFTGGIGTARKVMTAAAEGLTPVVLELGGKSANIIFKDAPLDSAIFSAVFGVAAMSGQGCLLPTRLLVEDAIYDEVVNQVVGIASTIKVGDPFDPSTMMGPVVSSGHCDRIMGIIADAVGTKAGELLTGGERLGGDLADGFFLPPTIFGEVDPGSSLAQNEVFGPVLSVLRFKDVDEAIGIANGTEYGLAGYVWTSDIKKGHQVASALEAGWIGINGTPPLAPNLPFGGVGNSGFGREGGRAGVREFLRTKNVFCNLA